MGYLNIPISELHRDGLRGSESSLGCSNIRDRKPLVLLKETARQFARGQTAPGNVIFSIPVAHRCKLYSITET